MKTIFTFLVAIFIAHNASAQLIINEVLYDPSNSGLAGDANGDGRYVRISDQFIEFVNIGTTPFDMSRYQICDSVIASGIKTIRHRIAQGTNIPAGGALVLFGGGTPVGNFGGAIVKADTGSAGLSMQNTGEWIVVADSTGRTVLRFNSDSLSDNPNESYNLSPDITGLNYRQHSSVCSDTTKLFSPGLKLDGTSYVLSSDFRKVNSNLIKVFPNPTSGRITIQSSVSLNEDVIIKDALGKTVFAGKLNNNTLDVSGLGSGVYYVVASSPSGRYSTKFVVSK